MKRILVIMLALATVFTFTACTGGTAEPASTGTVPQVSGAEPDTAVTPVPVSVEYDDDDLDDGWDGAEASVIRLEDDAISFEGAGATVQGSRITVTAAGTYVIGGTLEDGQIIVNTGDKEAVKLVLDGADITCTTSAPVYVISASKTVITLAEGTQNYVADGETYIFENEETDEPNAAVFSNSDLTINGDGALTVKASYNNGIQSKDELIITGGNITVNAANDGLKGRDGIIIKDGNFTIEAGGDGLQATNDEDAAKGFVAIEGGQMNITAGEDGIQAETSVLVSGGEIALSTGGGSVNSSNKATWGDWGGPRRMETAADNGDDSPSAKGIKAAVDITISGGNIEIDSSDDSLHANHSLVISGGEIVMASGDDGIHADTALEISGGDISITKSYEGIESSVITINDGNIHLVASDDGFNAAGGADGSSVNGRPGQNNFESSGNNYLYINGGYTVVNAAGDGIDVNGAIEMTGGTVIVSGPTDNGNGSLDYLGGFKISGGFLVATGSSGMAQAPGESSTQYSLMVNFDAMQPEGTLFHIETEDGADVLTFMPAKEYQSVVLSSPGLEKGVTYLVYTGGSATGTVTDDLYSGGSYTPGTEVYSLTISGMVTVEGSSGGGPGGGGGGGGGMMPPGGGRR